MLLSMVFICCVFIIIIISVIGIYFYTQQNKSGLQPTEPSGLLLASGDNKIITDEAYIPGYTIGSYISNVQSVEDCEKICMDNPKCQWFDYQKVGKYCYQKAGEKVLDQLIPKPSEIGFKLADGSYASYDKHYIGETLEDGSTNNLWEITNPVLGLTVEECRKECSKHPQCMYYRYGYGVKPRECHMKELSQNMMWVHGQIKKRV